MTVAYEVLRDPERRRPLRPLRARGRLRLPRPAARAASASRAGSGDIFEAFFGQMCGGGGRPARPAVRVPTPRCGSTSRSTRPSSARRRRSRSACRRLCTACSGRGTAPGTDPETCVDCQGTGELRRVRQSLLGQVVTSVACSRCRGHRRDDPPPLPGLPGRGAPHGGEHLHRRGAGRRGGRLDAAAGRPRRRRPARRRRTGRCSCTWTSRPTRASSARATTCTRR